MHIHEKTLEHLKALGKRATPLYTKAQLYQMFEHMKYTPVEEKIVLNPNLTVIFHKNSHVIGATSISIIITKPNNQKKVIVYSSDMGSELNREFQPFLWENNIPLKCNLFISEGTYNTKERQFTKQECIKERAELKKLIKDSIHENKRVLLATFSFSRGQMLMSMLHEWAKTEQWLREIPIVVDGVLINSINATYLNILEGEEKTYFQNIMNMENMKFNKDYNGTLATLSKRTCGIYITGSGFLTNGRITSYLPQFIANPKDVIILTGYSGAVGSLGSDLIDINKPTVKLDKITIKKQATIKQLRTFSSHISYEELFKLFSQMQCDKILIHHSDKANKQQFVEEAKEYLKSKNKTTPIVAVDGKYASQFIL